MTPDPRRLRRLLTECSAFYGVHDWLTMTCDVFMDHVDDIPRLRAQRLLDAARAAGAPYQPAAWWNAIEAQAYADDEDDASPMARPRSLLSVDGMPMSVGQAKATIAAAMGGGFSDAA